MDFSSVVQGYVWILTQWWFWMIWLLSVVVGWWLFSQRSYSIREGKAYVRHGRLGTWVDVEKHMREEHKEDVSRREGT